MHIIHLITTFERGGAENHLLDLSRGLVKRGNTVTIVALKKLDLDFSGTVGEGIRVIDLSYHSVVSKILFLRRLIKLELFDIVHAHLPIAEIFGSLICFRTKSPLIITRHVSGNFVHRFRRNIFLSVSRITLKRAQVIIAISHHVKNSLVNIEKASNSRIRVIYYGIDRNEFSCMRKEANFTESVKLICLSRLEPQKRILDILEGFKRLKSIFPKSSLIVCGEGSKMASYKQWVRDNALENHISLLGKISKVSEALCESDVFILASEYEGFGRVYLEAVASGLPIVSSRNDAAMEILGLENFFSFPIGDVDELVGALLRAFSESVTSRRLRLERYEKLLNFYSIEKMVDETICTYKQARLAFDSVT